MAQTWVRMRSELCAGRKSDKNQSRLNTRVHHVNTDVVLVDMGNVSQKCGGGLWVV